MTDCGFFGLSATVSEADLRAAVRFVAVAERENWFDADGIAFGELDNQQFGHLVRYWLARQDTIQPSTLSFVQAKSLEASIDYGDLLDRNTLDATVDTEVARVRANLLAGAPAVGGPVDLSKLVEEGLRG